MTAIRFDNFEIARFIRNFISGCICSFSLGCATTVVAPVTENERDMTGRFDGNWLATLNEPLPEQSMGQWVFRCESMPSAIELRVQDGVLTTKIGDDTYKSYISEQGSFRLLMKTKGVTSGSVGRPIEITPVLEGSLRAEKLSGSFTLSFENLGNNGCTTTTHFSRSTAAGTDQGIHTSRIFAGPSQYPPAEFNAYGILAFRSRVMNQTADQDRHQMICSAYASTLPHTTELGIPNDQQMVTVWPIDSDNNATAANKMSRDDICGFAIENYGLLTSQNAIRDAEKANTNISGRGPYLLAWSPAREKGSSNAPVLVSDLSDVTNYEEAQSIFIDWLYEIESDPMLWRSGLNIELLRTKIRQWADKYGREILNVFNAQ